MPSGKVVLAALVMAGAWSTVSVNAWVVRLDGALLAVIVMLYTPPPPAAGVPLNVAVPLLPAVKLTPPGRFPLSLSVVAAGTPAVVVIVKLPDVPTVKVVLAALVMAGAGHGKRERLGRQARRGVAGGDRDAVDAAGAGCRRATQRGRTIGLGREADAAGQVPALAQSAVAAGTPGVVVIVKLPGVPAVKVVLAAPVMTGACDSLTVSVKDCIASIDTPLLAMTSR